MNKVSEMQELKGTLIKHLELLKGYLKTADIINTNLYLPIAAQLRVLLCDAQTPILLSYADAKKIQLIIYGPRKFPQSLLQGIAFFINFKVSNWTPKSPGQTKYQIKTYLDIPIGYVAIDNISSSSLPSSYSMKQLIKWVANKEGICHLDFNKPTVFQHLKNFKMIHDNKEIDGGLIKVHLIHMAQWTVTAIQDVLAKQKDFSLLIKFKKIRSPKTNIRLLYIKSLDTETTLILSASNEGFIFSALTNSDKMGDVTVKYPKGWKKNQYCVLAFIYDSSLRTASVILNGEMSKQFLYCNLGGMMNGHPNGEILKGNHYNFTADILAYDRKVNTNDMMELYQLSEKGLKSLLSHIDPSNIHIPKVTLATKAYRYFYKKIFIR